MSDFITSSISSAVGTAFAARPSIPAAFMGEIHNEYLCASLLEWEM